jgi:hypothetical protein
MAEKRRVPQRATGGDPATQQVVALLTSILTEVRTQVRSSTPKPPDLAAGPRTLEGAAATAVALFREIGSTLALLPSITLTAEPARFTVSDNSRPPFTSKLTWFSTEARTVSIERVLNDNSTELIMTETPDASGSIPVHVSQTTTFRALAKARGPCDGAQTEAQIVVDDGNIIL